MLIFYTSWLFVEKISKDSLVNMLTYWGLLFSGRVS